MRRLDHDTTPLLFMAAIMFASLLVAIGSNPRGKKEDPPDVKPASQPQRQLNIRILVRAADLPAEIRTRNYKGGSCVHASFITCLRWQGLDDWADWWHEHHAYGEGISGLVGKANRAGLKIAYTDDGETSFLEWCSRTRRAAVIFYKPNHAINFVRFEAMGGREVAVLLDNNRIKEYEIVEKQTFLSRWRGFGGTALTPVYSPAPPLPTL